MTLENGERTKSRSNIGRRVWQHENTSILLVLIGMVILVYLAEHIINPSLNFFDSNFITGMNISNVLLQVSATGILALSMTLVMISGGIDLSVGNMLTFLGVGMAWLMKTGGWGEAETLALAVAVGVGLQLLMGLVISRTKIEPFIISLGFMSIYRGFTYLITNGREITIIGKLEFLKAVVFRINMNSEDPSSAFVVTVPIVLMFGLALIVWAVVKYTKFGRRVYAVGGNENAAYLAGINVKNFKLLIYGINGLFVTIASMALLARLGTGAPTMGLGKEIDVIAAVVVGGTAMSGGKGHIWGAMIGVLVLGIISNALNIIGIDPYYQFIISGLLIIFAVMIGYYSGLRTAKKSVRKTELSLPSNNKASSV
jgi:ribose/xylose/arabinose/galactoside ABC-type transport system permease subunit